MSGDPAFCIPFASASQGPRLNSQQGSERVCNDVSKRRSLQLMVAAALTSLIDIRYAACLHPCHAVSFTARQVVNSVLSGYGLPITEVAEGFSQLLEQYGKLVVQFLYPVDWIISRNVLATGVNAPDAAIASSKQLFSSVAKPMEGRAAGLTVGDYRKAEGLAFYVLSGVSNGQNVNSIPVETILELVTPGDATGQSAEYTVAKDYFDGDSGYRIIWTKVSIACLHQLQSKVQ